MINDAVKQNFNTLCDAVKNRRIVLMECKRKKDNEIVNLVCATNHDGNEIVMLPVAEMMLGDPFEDYYPPDPDGGFFEGDLNAGS
jgi:hypothetical protein